MLKILRAIEARPGTDEFETKTVRSHDEQRADQMELERQSQELFEVLAMITEGEAKLMVRKVLTQDEIVAPQPAIDGEGIEDAQGGDAPQAGQRHRPVDSGIVT